MQVKIEGYVSKSGYFRPYKINAIARPGEVMLTAMVDVPDELFEPRQVTVEIPVETFADDVASLVWAEAKRPAPPEPTPKPERPIPHHLTPAVARPHLWTGPKLFTLMARLNLTYADMAGHLDATEAQVRGWSKQAGILRITAEQANTLTRLNGAKENAA